MRGLRNLREWIETLRKHGEIVDIYAEVDPHLEIAEIHRRVAAATGPALFFHNVKGSPFPVVTNLLGSPKRVDLAFPPALFDAVHDLVHLATKDFPPSFKTLWNKRKSIQRVLSLGKKSVRSAPVLESGSNTTLNDIPLLQLWPEDGGHFVTLPLVYTEPVEPGPPNLGMYRIQRYDERTTGLHFQIGKGGGFHYKQAEEKGVDLPVSIFIGGPPALILSAIAPLPENVPETLLASLLLGEKLPVGKSSASPHPVIAECEFALLGHAKPHERRLEGPFGDHYGYYSLEHPFPVFHCDKIYHRKDAIYPATVVGKPRQEDFYIGDALQKLLSPLFPVVMPSVKALWSYGETGFHSLAAAVVKERYSREAMSTAFRILGEGQLALTKFLLLTDQPVDLSDFKKTLPVILERFEPQKDLYIFANLSLDTLDYTGPKLNEGSRGVLVGLGEPKRKLYDTFSGNLPNGATKAAVFCPGCLVIETNPYTQQKDLNSWTEWEAFKAWPLVFAVDDLNKTLKNTASFLWTCFTRFEPAADIYAKSSSFRHHLAYELPIVIDSRMKPTYPKEVIPDENTFNLVSKRWHEYFPSHMTAGDSVSADV